VYVKTIGGYKVVIDKFCMLLGLLAILLAMPVTADSAELAGRPITFDEALAQALSENPEFAAAQWNTGIAQGARTQAGLIPNPELSWSVEDTRRDSRITSIQVSQPIELGGKRGI